MFHKPARFISRVHLVKSPYKTFGKGRAGSKRNREGDFFFSFLKAGQSEFFIAALPKPAGSREKI